METETNLEIKTILKLKGCNFRVPAYQRGYRWTEYEVRTLLDDIYDFLEDNNQTTESYCIQPLIVKKGGDDVYDVVDGQQRLTTIYIFMKIAEQEIRSATSIFNLSFQTRKESESFLKNLSDEIDLEEEKCRNIDYFHIVAAYQAMNDWLSEKEDKSTAIQKLNTGIREKVFFIWYEIPEDADPIDRFRKVNMGKIPLTNAELIKALIMNKENFNTDSEKKQTEISISWDRIEQGLQNESFWYFLNEKEQYKTRIDLIFNLLAKQRNKNLGRRAVPFEQNYFSFLVLSTEMSMLKESKEKEEYVENLWRQVEAIYSDFMEWYNDIEKYHIIGYLICVGANVDEIYALSKNKKKSEVLQALLDKTQNMSGIGKTDNYEFIDQLSYDETNQRKRIKKLLLLFNIATIVCNSEKQYRFPFYLYKQTEKNKNGWDLEHIHATADESAEADDNIGNLTLLDSKTNRSYKDETFNEKRKVILDNEKNGRFIPICTKNIFLKAYTKNPHNMSIWEQEDKYAYIQEMKEMFKKFYERKWMKNEENTKDFV